MGLRAFGYHYFPVFFYMANDAERLRACQEGAERMAPAIDGTVVLVDKDTVGIDGRFGGFRVRVRIWAQFGSPTIHLARKSGRIKYAGLVVHGEFEPGVTVMPEPNDFDADPEGKLYLSPRVCMHGRYLGLREDKEIWDSMPPELATRLVKLLEGMARPGSPRC
jgi:hypothetical protein